MASYSSYSSLKYTTISSSYSLLFQVVNSSILNPSHPTNYTTPSKYIPWKCLSRSMQKLILNSLKPSVSLNFSILTLNSGFKHSSLVTCLTDVLEINSSVLVTIQQHISYPILCETPTHLAKIIASFISLGLFGNLSTIPGHRTQNIYIR